MEDFQEISLNDTPQKKKEESPPKSNKQKGFYAFNKVHQKAANKSITSFSSTSLPSKTDLLSSPISPPSSSKADQTLKPLPSSPSDPQIYTKSNPTVDIPNSTSKHSLISASLESEPGPFYNIPYEPDFSDIELSKSESEPTLKSVLPDFKKLTLQIKKKRKRKVQAKVSLTRQIGLPPKDYDEDQKHMKQYQQMMRQFIKKEERKAKLQGKMPAKTELT